MHGDRRQSESLLNNTAQQCDLFTEPLQSRRLLLFNLGTWGTEVPLSPVLRASVAERVEKSRGKYELAAGSLGSSPMRLYAPATSGDTAAPSCRPCHPV